MLVLKGCGKCQSGDLYVYRGVGEADLVCLQCGYRWPVRPPDAVSKRRA